MRVRVLQKYGGCCFCCGETSYEFLSIDHVYGGGTKHVKSIGGTYAFMKFLDQNHKSIDFRILCHNCNMARGIYGYCPHERLGGKTS